MVTAKTKTKAQSATVAATKGAAAASKSSAKTMAVKKVAPPTASLKGKPVVATKPIKPMLAKAKAVPAQEPKAKLIRDSFTIPKLEYAAIDELKQRAAKLARPTKKSELLRAGIKALSSLNDKALLAALQAVPTIKTGRPGKS